MSGDQAARPSGAGGLGGKLCEHRRHAAGGVGFALTLRTALAGENPLDLLLWLNGRGPSAGGPESDETLAPLAHLDDYEQASLLVDVIGEGQILDIFKIVHDLAPDEATRRIVLLSRRDEARHVSYGVARLKHRLETARDPEAVGAQVVNWIADRIGVSDEFFTLPDGVQRALGVLGREAGVDGRARARAFPAEANRFRAGRLDAAGLPPRAQQRIRALLSRAGW